MRKLISTAVVIGLSGLLIGCPAPSKTGKTGKTDAKTGDAKTGDAKTGDAKTGDAKTGGGDAGAAKSVDISHVKKGQVYVYEMETSGMKMMQKYVVTDVTDTAVKYKTITVMNGTETPGGEAEWTIPATTAAAPAATPAAEVKMSKETIEAAGQKWDCNVTESGGTKTWSPTKNGLPTFPIFIKMEGPTKSTLTKVE